METKTAAVTSAAAMLFQLEFKQDVFLTLGVVYFTLLMYWFVSLKDRLFARIQKSSAERNWIFFSLFAGLCFGITCAVEWGWPSAGTALSVGLCIGLGLVHPAAAACLLASSLYLRPWELTDQDPYLSLLPRLSFLLCVAHLFLGFAKSRRIKLEWSQVTSLLVFFSIWCCVTTLFAPDAQASLGSFVNGFTRSIFLYFLLIQMVRTKPALKMLVGTLLISFLFVGAVSIYQTIQMNSLVSEGDLRLRGFGAFTNSNDIAALMVFILPFAAFAFVRNRESALMKFLGAGLSLVALVTVVLSRSRGAMMGIAAMIAAYLIFRIGKKAIVPVTVGIVLLAVPATIIVGKRSAEDLEGSSAGRMTYLKAGVRMGFSNPVFGVGFDAYPLNLQKYSTESLEENQQMTAHNSWVLVFAESGFMGLILFTAAFVFCLRYGWEVYGQSPEFLLALIGYAVAIFFLSHSYLIYPYLLYALVHIARRIQKPEVA